MTNPNTRGPTATQLNSPEQRTRRKISREVGAMYDDIARAKGFEPAERRAAFAISMRLYERSDQPASTPRGLPLASIGSALTSKSDDKEACERTAARHVGQLFNHAIPRTGCQILTRFKALKDGLAHEYADHLTPIAAFFSELLAEETERILADKTLDRKAKGAAIGAARARLVAEACDYLPRCEVEVYLPAIVDDAGDIKEKEERYAYMTAPAADELCRLNPDLKTRKVNYIPPEEREKPVTPLLDREIKRIKQKLAEDVTAALNDMWKRNGFADATRLMPELRETVVSAEKTWLKVARTIIEADKKRSEGEKEELIHASDLSGVALPEHPEPDDMTPDNLSGVPFDNWPEYNDLEEPIFESIKNAPDEIDPEPGADLELETVPATVALVGSENFDTSLEAALFYVKDGWAVVPCCQFNSKTERCTGPESHHKGGVCKGKVPLIAGPKDKDGRPKGEGYQAASRDKGLVRDWLTRQFPDAGVALRLDRATPEGQETNILLDFDVKDGAPGLATRECLHDTFDLPETLTAATPSGGIHEIYALPDGLPADYLGSWTRVLDPDDLGGLDIKVGVKGLAHVEPSRGARGVYRWGDPCATIATLPRVVCDYLHEVHERRKLAQEQRAVDFAQSQPAGPFDPNEDQAKFFKNVPSGERHPRLLKIARRIRAAGASAAQIRDTLTWHAERFDEPLHDPAWIARVAQESCVKYQPEAPRATMGREG